MYHISFLFVLFKNVFSYFIFISFYFPSFSKIVFSKPLAFPYPPLYSFWWCKCLSILPFLLFVFIPWFTFLEIWVLIPLCFLPLFSFPHQIFDSISPDLWLLQLMILLLPSHFEKFSNLICNIYSSLIFIFFSILSPNSPQVIKNHHFNKFDFYHANKTIYTMHSND